MTRQGTLSAHLGLAVVLAAALIAGAPLLVPKILSGHDVIPYIVRMAEYHENIRHGIFPPRWAPSLGSGYGEPLWLIAPPLVQMAGELMRLAGASLIASHNLGLLLFYLIGATGSYFLGARIAGQSGGILCGVSFVFAPYVLLDLYVRHAAAEFAGLCLLPLVLLGVDGIARFRRPRDTVLLALGIGGAGLSHPTAFLVAVLLAVTLVVVLAATRRDRAIAVYGAGAILLGIGLTAVTALPGLFAQADTQFGGLKALRPYGLNFVYPRQLLVSPWGYGHSQIGPIDGMSFALGVPWIILGLVALVRTARSCRNFRAWVVTLAVIAIAGAVMTTGVSDPVWRQSESLQLMVFPWRFLMIPAICLVALAPFAARGFPGAAIAAAAAIAVFSYEHARPESYLPGTDAHFTPQQIANRGFRSAAFAEFQPRWIETPRAPARGAFDPPMAVDTLHWTPVRRTLRLTGSPAGPTRLALSYFPGWTVRVDGSETAIVPARGTGLIEFELPPGARQVEARFARTPSVIAGEAIALFSLLLLAGVGVLARGRAVTGLKCGCVSCRAAIRSSSSSCLVHLPDQMTDPNEARPSDPERSPRTVSIRTDYLIAGIIVLAVVVFLGRSLFDNGSDPSAPAAAAGSAARPPGIPALAALSAEQQAEYTNGTDNGLSHFAGGRYAEAEAAFRRALAVMPDDPVANNNVASALNAQRRFDDAIPLLEKALRIDPTFDRAKSNLAYAQAEKAAGGVSP